MAARGCRARRGGRDGPAIVSSVDTDLLHERLREVRADSCPGPINDPARLLGEAANSTPLEDLDRYDSVSRDRRPRHHQSHPARRPHPRHHPLARIDVSFRSPLHG